MENKTREWRLINPGKLTPIANKSQLGAQDNGRWNFVNPGELTPIRNDKQRFIDPGELTPLTDTEKKIPFHKRIGPAIRYIFTGTFSK